MKSCPKCSAKIGPLKSLTCSKWSPLKCPSCGTKYKLNQGKSALVGGVVGGLTYFLVVSPYNDGDFTRAGLGFVVGLALATVGFWLFVPGEEVGSKVEVNEANES